MKSFFTLLKSPWPAIVACCCIAAGAFAWQALCAGACDVSTGLAYAGPPAAESTATSTESKKDAEAAPEAKTSHDPLMAVACQMSCARKADTYAEADIVSQPGAKVGDLVRCPVSGVVFAVTKDHTQVDVGGKPYFTCCGTCGEKLKEDPKRFVATTAAPAAAKDES